MISYEATFGETHFHIDLQTSAGADGPGFVAVPYQFDGETQVRHPIPDEHGGRLEFRDASEAGALIGAQNFLVGHYGHQAGPFTAVPPSTPAP